MYGFVFMFHSNYGCNLRHFRMQLTGLKMLTVTYPNPIRCSHWGDPIRILAKFWYPQKQGYATMSH